MTLITVRRGAHEDVRSRSLVQRHGHHPLGGVETQREMSGAGGAQPEMFPAPHLPPIFAKSCWVRGIGFRQKQLSLAKRKEGNGAGWVSAFLQHGLGPVFFVGVSPRKLNEPCTRKAEQPLWNKNLLTCVCSKLAAQADRLDYALAMGRRRIVGVDEWPSVRSRRRLA